jgi:hypothetical protein
MIIELQGIEEAKSDAGILTFKSALAHDDTVMSLAMAVKNIGSRKSMLSNFIFTSDDVSGESRAGDEKRHVPASLTPDRLHIET